MCVLTSLKVHSFFPQFVPESPRYLIIHGKEEKAKKVLALIARLNCKQPLVGRLVTQEEKERMLQERSQSCSPANGIVETSMMEPGSPPGEIESEPRDYGTLPNNEENGQLAVSNDITVLSSDNESDHELLIASDEHTHRQKLSLKTLKKKMKEKAGQYYYWFLLLFKNGWWRTTLLLWYLWSVFIHTYITPGLHKYIHINCSTISILELKLVKYKDKIYIILSIMPDLHYD